MKIGQQKYVNLPCLNTSLFERTYSSIIQIISNRPDGSYATGDLFKRHHNERSWWKFARRADDFISLVRLTLSQRAIE